MINFMKISIFTFLHNIVLDIIGQNKILLSLSLFLRLFIFHTSIVFSETDASNGIKFITSYFWKAAQNFK